MIKNIKNIANAVKGTLKGTATGTISEICTDSRTLLLPQQTLFVALVGSRNDGHKYIPSLYERGVRSFLISQKISIEQYPDAAFIEVENTLDALQTLAQQHREQFSYPVVGITGSNGKTIVKEWAAQLLLPQLRLVRSPKSYNSQLGVPLSVLQMTESVDMAIFEAGISLPNEMEQLEKIIHPNVVLLANIGEAHQEGFASRQQKLSEKLKLCHAADVIVCCADQREITDAVKTSSTLRNKKIITWGKTADADLHIEYCKNTPQGTEIAVQVPSTNYQLPNVSSVRGTFPPLGVRGCITIHCSLSDAASIENAMHAFALCYCLSQYCPQLKIDLNKAAQGIAQLAPVAMRLDLCEGIHQCAIVNDAYSADVASLRIALDFLTTCSYHQCYTAILSDFEQSGKESWRLYGEIAALLNEKGVSQLIGIGKEIAAQSDLFHCKSIFYETTEQFLQQFDATSLHAQAILIKGSRAFGLERISQQLEQHTHLTTLEVNLSAMAENLNVVRNSLKINTKTLVLVKANAYGTGLCEVARFLQQQGVDYLGVAFADEGIALRQAGITLPILVLNPEPGTFDQIIAHRLEPEIYSFAALDKFNETVVRTGEIAYPIHIKLDTGMHRLGFLPNETDALLQQLQRLQGNLRVASIFSHLAAADEPQHDDFTRSQITLFDRWSKTICNSLKYNVLRHIANSSGAVRFPDAQMDMIRLGVSFYGINVHHDKEFRHTCTLKSTVVQIKTIAQGETIGYGRKAIAAKDTVIGLIPIGYADGFNRSLGNGKYKVMINNKLAPIIGNICMDMCMLDLSGIPAREGDEAVIFGENPAIEFMAQQLNTIPYEILTRISTRVKRVYFYE
ncbi:bifunctional UDP-N-acetylmuramoyl-tripeptide:D-alanyl-D-alanine ligase/alanine racemase [Bacteroidia bacterium]|nr:bifunctional UDP-N-acetylmuramoyl-tripeptide:D-alanyl-D-alanine ligase/alanine racemase [Bacteroidia bacterium]